MGAKAKDTKQSGGYSNRRVKRNPRLRLSWLIELEGFPESNW